MVTPLQLQHAGIGPTQAAAFAQPLSAALAQFGIDTPARIGAFIGQCMVESALFVHLEEDLYYSDPTRIAKIFHSHFASASDAVAYARNPTALGSRVYANYNGNGDEASGDGFKYRGGGLIDITGLNAYRKASAALGRDYVGQPELVGQPIDACLVAAWWWADHSLNALADACNYDGITHVVNGAAMEAAALRKQYSQQAVLAVNA